MEFFSSFQNIETLNAYNYSVHDQLPMVKIDSVHKVYALNHIDLLPLFRDLADNSMSTEVFENTINTVYATSENTLIDPALSLQLSELEDTRIFPWSKTLYRKTIHEYMIESLYKKYYDTLKTSSFITAANGSYVLVKMKNLELVDYEKIHKVPTLISGQNITEYITALEDDNKFYSAKIKEMAEKISKLTELKDLLVLQVNNKSLTTWY